MLILAIDTSHEQMRLSLGEAGKEIIGQVKERGGRHLAGLIPAIEEVLGAAGVKKTAISALAAVQGPGSYAGLRIGTATIQGLARALAVPCLGLNALELCAHEQLAPERYVLSGYNARNRRIYGTIYYGEKELIAKQVKSLDFFLTSLHELLEQSPGELYFAGDETLRAYAQEETISEFLGQRPVFKTAFYATATLSKLAYQEALAQNFLRPAELVPLYYALSSAEQAKLRQQDDEDS